MNDGVQPGWRPLHASGRSGSAQAPLPSVPAMDRMHRQRRPGSGSSWAAAFSMPRCMLRDAAAKKRDMQPVRDDLHLPCSACTEAEAAPCRQGKPPAFFQEPAGRTVRPSTCRDPRRTLRHGSCFAFAVGPPLRVQNECVPSGMRCRLPGCSCLLQARQCLLRAGRWDRRSGGTCFCTSLWSEALRHKDPWAGSGTKTRSS